MGRPIPSLLPRALDPHLVEPTLARIAHSRFGPSTVIDDLAAEVVERRVVRYTLRGRAAGRPLFWSIVGKVYESESQGELAFAAHRTLWQRGFPTAPPRTTSIPEVYGYAAVAHTLLMEEVGGRPLKRLLKSRTAQPAHMRLFAESLAKLHRFPMTYGAPFTVEDHLARRCAGLPGPLMAALPALAAPVERLIAAARRCRHGNATLAHGDYHAGQVHVADDRMWILDLDPLHQGDPAYDVAMVFVTLKLLAGRLGLAGYGRSLWDAFQRAYFAQMDLEIAARLPLQAALILLKRACKRFRWQDEPGWEETVELQVRTAAEFLRLQEAAARPQTLADVLALYDAAPEAA